MEYRADIVIIGAGFGGSLMAMVAKRLGRSVILIERGTHPRFAIGESTTPLANLLLQQLAEDYMKSPDKEADPAVIRALQRLADS